MDKCDLGNNANVRESCGDVCIVGNNGLQEPATIFLTKEQAVQLATWLNEAIMGWMENDEVEG